MNYPVNGFSQLMMGHSKIADAYAAVFVCQAVD